jgi:hypothetical protein
LTLDILEALAAEAPARSSRKCKIQRWLDNISDDHPGKTELAATIVTTDPKSADYRTLDQLDKVLLRLGLISSIKTIGDHRGERCRCYV